MNRDFKNKLSVLFIFASFLFFNASYAATPSEVGIIVLHGKGSSPNFPVLQKFESKMPLSYLDSHGAGKKVKQIIQVI